MKNLRNLMHSRNVQIWLNRGNVSEAVQNFYSVCLVFLPKFSIAILAAQEISILSCKMFRDSFFTYR